MRSRAHAGTRTAASLLQVAGRGEEVVDVGVDLAKPLPVPSGAPFADELADVLHHLRVQHVVVVPELVHVLVDGRAVDDLYGAIPRHVRRAAPRQLHFGTKRRGRHSEQVVGAAHEVTAEDAAIPVPLDPERPQQPAKHLRLLGPWPLLIPSGHELLQPAAVEQGAVVGVVVGGEVLCGPHHLRQQLHDLGHQHIRVHHGQGGQVQPGVPGGRPLAQRHPPAWSRPGAGLLPGGLEQV
mmetsp:Transcript_86115/g.256957  ORF Transcript_86115/g.256957 Transcript_86115/m.256957 type:complete len:238 (-) Transcript_86115:1722-2435(-)